MSEPRAKTLEEIREDFLAHIRTMVAYWARRDETPQRMCEGVAFSILAAIDGCAGLPAMDLVCRPHEDDKEFQRSEGENWIEDGTVINNDCHLHELFYPQEPKP